MMSFSNEKEEKRRHLPPPHRSCLGVCTSPARELYTWLLYLMYSIGGEIFERYICITFIVLNRCNMHLLCSSLDNFELYAALYTRQNPADCGSRPYQVSKMGCC